MNHTEMDSFDNYIEDLNMTASSTPMRNGNDSEVIAMAKTLFDKINVEKKEQITYFAMEKYVKSVLRDLEMES
mgnify:CR=1 FL=1